MTRKTGLLVNETQRSNSDAVRHIFSYSYGSYSSGNVSTVSKPAQCANVPAPDAGLARRCAQTTLQLTELQKWVKSVTQ